jgi:hypothetical protein
MVNSFEEDASGSSENPHNKAAESRAGALDARLQQSK